MLNVIILTSYFYLHILTTIARAGFGIWKGQQGYHPSSDINKCIRIYNGHYQKDEYENILFIGLSVIDSVDPLSLLIVNSSFSQTAEYTILPVWSDLSTTFFRYVFKVNH